MIGSQLTDVPHPQEVHIVFKDEIVDGIPCVSLELQAEDSAKVLAEPTPAMWMAIYISRQFYDGKLMPLVEDFVRDGQFVKPGALNGG